LYLERE
jgi:hypothetical protein